MSESADRPWHRPGKWLVNQAYWYDEAMLRARRRGAASSSSTAPRAKATTASGAKVE